MSKRVLGFGGFLAQGDGEGRLHRKVAVCGKRVCRPRSVEGQGERDLFDELQLLVVLEEARVSNKNDAKYFHDFPTASA
jgi:hypothetical protein